MSHVLIVFAATHGDLHDSLLRDISLLKKHRWVHTHLLLLSQSTNVYYYNPLTHRSYSIRAPQPIGMDRWFQITAKWIHQSLPDPSALKVTFLFSGHSNSFYLRPTETVYHSVAEVRKMIQRSFPKGFRFETMIFDSCAMASLEALYEFRECTRFMLAAQVYLDDEGFLSSTVLNRIDRLADDDNHVQKVQILNDISRMYSQFPDQWNASLLCTDGVKEVVRQMSSSHESVTPRLPYVYPGYHLVDLFAWFREGRVRDLLRERVILWFTQNSEDAPHNHGLSITPGTTRWNGFSNLYQELSLWKDSAPVRHWHSKMDVDMRVMSVNLQFCETIEDLEGWQMQWHDAEADLVCVQELGKRCLNHLLQDEMVQVLHHDEKMGTAVIWIKQASHSSSPLPRSVWVRSIHLNDVPSIPHHQHHLLYEGNPPLETSLEDVVRMSKATRGPELESVLAEASSSRATHYLLAGDFNEPSHLDPVDRQDRANQSITFPISTRMEEDGWVDVMHVMDCTKPTWPTQGFFAQHPSQRIDFLYLKGKWRVTYADRYVPKTPGWKSDHYALLCDLTIKK